MYQRVKTLINWLIGNGKKIVKAWNEADKDTCCGSATCNSFNNEGLG